VISRALECELVGYLRTSGVPTDRRAKIVRYTTKGDRILASLPQVVHAATHDMESIVGRPRMDALGEILELLLGNAVLPATSSAIKRPRRSA
jgi:DNA-binding MarR family transcriptional regulator